MVSSTEFTTNKMLPVESDFCARRLFICLYHAIANKAIGKLASRSKDVFVGLDSADHDAAFFCESCRVRHFRVWFPAIGRDRNRMSRRGDGIPPRPSENQRFPGPLSCEEL